MPKSTFMNLPEGKRGAIIGIAFEEFALNSYEHASLSRIVERAGIAKGSMYQYFADKHELYLYLVDLAAEDKLSFLGGSIESADGGFFDLYRSIIYNGGRYNLEHPLQSSILYNAVRESRSSELAAVAGQLIRQSQDYIRNLLESGVSRGEVRADVDLDLAAFVINRVSLDLEDYLGDAFGFSYKEILRKRRRRLPITETELSSVVDGFVAILENGLRSR